MNTVKRTETLDVAFTQDEIVERAQEVASLHQTVTQLEDEKKAAADAFKLQIEEKRNRISELVSEINKGSYQAAREVKVVMNHPTIGMKQLLDAKTNDVIKTVPMTPEDRQISFLDRSYNSDTDAN